MYVYNDTLIESVVDMSADFTLEPVFLGNIFSYSIQLAFEGAPIGEFKLECSNDKAKGIAPGRQTQSSSVTSWTDVTDSHQSITEAGNHTWDTRGFGYQWARVSYSATSGAGQLVKARMTAKGS